MSNFESPVNSAPQPPIAPAPVPPVAPTAAKGLAVAALVVGIVAVLIGFFPVAGIIVGAVAVILGIVALVKRQSKAFALTGLILGAVGLITSLIVTILAGVVVGAAIDSVQKETGVNVQTEGEEAGDDTLGTRENPIALGTTIEGKEYTVVINSVTLGQNDAVLAANPFNEAPAAGSSYAVINYTVTYTGADSGNAGLVSIDYVTSAGNVVDATSQLVVAPEPAIGFEELFAGASATGNTALAFPDGDEGVLRVRAGLLTDPVFVAIK